MLIPKEESKAKQSRTIYFTEAQLAWLEDFRVVNSFKGISDSVRALVDQAIKDDDPESIQRADDILYLARFNRATRQAARGRTDIEWVELTHIDQIGNVEPFRFVESNGV